MHKTMKTILLAKKRFFLRRRGSSCEEEDDDDDYSHDQEDDDDQISEENSEEEEEGKEESSSKREEGRHVCIVPHHSTSFSCPTLPHRNVHETWTLSTSPDHAPTASCPILSIDAHAVSLFDTATYHVRGLHQKYWGMFDSSKKSGDDKLWWMIFQCRRHEAARSGVSLS